MRGNPRNYECFPVTVKEGEAHNQEYILETLERSPTNPSDCLLKGKQVPRHAYLRRNHNQSLTSAFGCQLKFLSLNLYHFMEIFLCSRHFPQFTIFLVKMDVSASGILITLENNDQEDLGEERIIYYSHYFHPI